MSISYKIHGPFDTEEAAEKTAVELLQAQRTVQQGLNYQERFWLPVLRHTLDNSYYVLESNVPNRDVYRNGAYHPVVRVWTEGTWYVVAD